MIIPRRIHLATQSMPAAFSEQDFFDIPVGTRELTFYVTMEPAVNGNNGVPEFQFQWSSDLAGTEDARDLITDGGSGLTISGPDGRYQVLLSQFRGPDDSSDTVYAIRCCVPGGSRRVRLQVRAEQGAGDVTIALTGSS